MNLFYYRVREWEVIDGDTLDLVIDVGFHVRVAERVRLMGVNTPESHSRAPEPERSKGIDAKNWLHHALIDARSAGAEVYVQTHRIVRRSGDVDERTGKYGRYMVTLWIKAKDGTLQDLNHALVAQGHANFYDGGKRPALGSWEWAGEEQLA